MEEEKLGILQKSKMPTATALGFQSLKVNSMGFEIHKPCKCKPQKAHKAT